MELCRLCKYKYAGTNKFADPSGFIFINKCLEYRNKYKKTIDTSIISGIIYITINPAVMENYMDKKQSADPKEKVLRKCGAFNTHPVTDALFKDNHFFDPRDLVQVKYEMLRKVHKERQPISHVAASFGFSRPAFYQTMGDFQREGIAGLLPRKRGPQGGHKLTHQVLEFIEEILAMDKQMSIPVLLDEVEKRFGVRVHRRSLERARRRREKKMPQIPKKTGRQKPKTMS